MAAKVFALVLLLIAAGPQWAQNNSISHSANEINLYGCGSTISNPLLQEWASEYNRIHPEINVQHQSIGSGGGMRQLLARNTTVGVIEGPMTDEQLAQSSGRILHFPIALRAVVPAYNLPQVQELHLSGSTLADIFLGKITRWNDPAIANDNPRVDLPKIEIKVVHEFPRRDNAAFVATDYLSKISPEFKSAVDHSDGRSWPTPTGMGHGGGGWTIAAAVHTFPGSIGFTDRLLAQGEHLQYAAIKNAGGEFVMPSLESITAAGSAAMPLIQTKAQDFRILITNVPGKMAYPVSSFIWLILYDDDKNAKQHEAMIDFLKWILTDGQKIAPKLDYAPLPPELVELELKQIKF